MRPVDAGSGLGRTDRLLDEDEILDLAERLSKESSPGDVVGAVADIYGDAFALERDQAFELAAVMLGDRALAKLAPVQDAGDEVVRAFRRRIESLPSEIRRLESDLTADGAEIETLRGRIASRKTEIETERTGRSRAAKLMIALFTYEPSLEIAYREDETIRGLEAEVRRLERKCSDGRIALIRYRTPRIDLESRLDRLSAFSASLYDALGEPSRPRPPQVSAREGEARLARREKLKEVLEAELGALLELEEDAKALGVPIESAIAQVRSAARSL